MGLSRRLGCAGTSDRRWCSVTQPYGSMNTTCCTGSPAAALAHETRCQHDVDVADDPLAHALRRALTQSPGSRRALAEAAGIDHTLLARILAGERRATPQLCRRVMRALERWGTDCAAGAAILRRTLTGKGG